MFSWFLRFSIDLIFGLSDQTPDAWKHNLTRAIELDVPHISTYSLTIEPKTPLYKQIANGQAQQISDVEMGQLYDYTIDTLGEAGYEHYEVSNFSKPNHRSQHNQLYWQHTNYLGLGPAAHSFWRSADFPATRWANVNNIKQYVEWNDKPPNSFREEVNTHELANEYIMLRLRTGDGLSLDKLKQEYGTILGESTLQELVSEGLATINSNILQLTKKGLMVCDAVTERLLA